MRKHKARKDGGRTDSTESPKEVYAGEGSNVVKEAEERKHGGRVHKKAHGGKVEGEMSKRRADRPARKSGGRCGSGSDMSPYSSASKI